jgi:hypothetical protein
MASQDLRELGFRDSSDQQQGQQPQQQQSQQPSGAQR